MSFNFLKQEGLEHLHHVCLSVCLSVTPAVSGLKKRCSVPGTSCVFCTVWEWASSTSSVTQKHVQYGYIRNFNCFWLKKTSVLIIWWWSTVNSVGTWLNINLPSFKITYTNVIKMQSLKFYDNWLFDIWFKNSDFEWYFHLTSEKHETWDRIPDLSWQRSISFQQASGICSHSRVLWVVEGWPWTHDILIS